MDLTCYVISGKEFQATWLGLDVVCGYCWSFRYGHFAVLESYKYLLATSLFLAMSNYRLVLNGLSAISSGCCVLCFFDQLKYSVSLILMVSCGCVVSKVFTQ